MTETFQEIYKTVIRNHGNFYSLYLHWYDQHLPVAPLSIMRNMGLLTYKMNETKYSPHWIAMVWIIVGRGILGK